MATSSVAQTDEFRVLIFSKTEGYRHASIPAGIAAFEELAAASHESSPTQPAFSIHATEDAIVFNPSTLNQYRVIVFLQTSGDFLDNESQLSALEAFVRGGGGVVGVHGASTGLRSSEWYGEVLGAVFVDHPKPQNGRIVVEDQSHPTAWKQSSSEFEWFDEWYNFAANPRDRGVHVLLSVRETSYEGGTMGKDHPIAWCQQWGGGRSFYTALGHFNEAFSDSSFRAQLHNAILWTSGWTATSKQ